MAKILAAVVISFFVGVLANHFYTSSTSKTNADSAAAECKNLSTAKSDLINISQNEYLEYTKIKDLKQKYEKADELLGKVMLLFLADVGFRVQKEPVIETNTEQPITASNSQVAGGGEPQSLPISKQNSNETVAAVQQANINSGLDGKSALIGNLKSGAEIRSALDKAIIENPKVETAKGSILSQRQAAPLEGNFRGVIRFIDTQRENLNVTWELTPERGANPPSSNFHLSIAGPSKSSETNGHGQIGNVSSLAEDPHAFLVNACGDECYLQLYFNAPSNTFYGNYYELNKAKKFDRVGLVELSR